MSLLGFGTFGKSKHYWHRPDATLWREQREKWDEQHTKDLEDVRIKQELLHKAQQEEIARLKAEQQAWASRQPTSTTTTIVQPSDELKALRAELDALKAAKQAAPTPPPPPKPAAPKPPPPPPKPPTIMCPKGGRARIPSNWHDAAAKQRYLQRYPDVAQAVKGKAYTRYGRDALWHYACHGHKEGRQWAGLDGVRRPGLLGGWNMTPKRNFSGTTQRPGILGYYD